MRFLKSLISDSFEFLLHYFCITNNTKWYESIILYTEFNNSNETKYFKKVYKTAIKKFFYHVECVVLVETHDCFQKQS